MRRRRIPVSRADVRERFVKLVDEANGVKAPRGSEDLADLIERAGGRSRLAEHLAGTTDKSSRAYKSQRDYISRVMRGGRGIGKAKTESLKGAARKLAADEFRSTPAPIGVTVAAGFKVSDSRWDGAASQTFSGADREEFLRMLEDGDYDGILDLVVNEYSGGSGFADHILDVVDFEDFRFEI